jgi:hypothetical protein
MRRNGCSIVLVALAWCLAAPAQAVTIWNEAVDGDLSSLAAAPTAVAFVVGSNVITGVMGGADARDYITFTLAPGQALVALNLLLYTNTSGGPGNRGWHSINAGATSFVPSVTTAGLFLGGDHLDPPSGVDLLPNLAAAPLAGTGFTIPLGPGSYSYLAQQTSAVTNYSLEFVVTPEPSALALLLCAGAAGLALAHRRSRLP